MLVVSFHSWHACISTNQPPAPTAANAVACMLAMSWSRKKACECSMTCFLSGRSHQCHRYTNPSNDMQSAARSKERREQHTLDLEGRVDTLRLELAASQAEAQQLRKNVKRLGEAHSSIEPACAMQANSRYPLNIMCVVLVRCSIKHNHPSRVRLAFKLNPLLQCTRLPLFPEYLVLCLSGAASSAMLLGQPLVQPEAYF